MEQKLGVSRGLQHCPISWAKLHLLCFIAEETMCVLKENMTQVGSWLNQEEHLSQGLWRPL